MNTNFSLYLKDRVGKCLKTTNQETSLEFAIMLISAFSKFLVRIQDRIAQLVAYRQGREFFSMYVTDGKRTD